MVQVVVWNLHYEQMFIIFVFKTEWYVETKEKQEYF